MTNQEFFRKAKNWYTISEVPEESIFFNPTTYEEVTITPKGIVSIKLDWLGSPESKKESYKRTTIQYDDEDRRELRLDYGELGEDDHYMELVEPDAFSV